MKKYILGIVIPIIIAIFLIGCTTSSKVRCRINLLFKEVSKPNYMVLINKNHKIPSDWLKKGIRMVL